MSLTLGKPNFKIFFYDETLANTINYGAGMSQSTAESFLAKYYLPSYNFEPWRFPTEGQIAYMFANNYMQRTNNSNFWVRDAATSALRLVTVGGVTTDTNSGKVYRFVTDSVPNTCEDGKCQDFIDKRPWVIKFYSSQSIRWGWGVRYIDSAGVAQEVNGDWEGQANIPDGATAVNAYMWKTGVASANLYDMETTRDGETVVCLSVGGAPGVSVINKITCP